MHLRAAPAGGVALPEDAPSLVLRPPESARGAVISGGVSALIHIAAIAVLALLAWFAPEVVNIIPVKIIQELPGSNEPAPAPRKVIARRPVASISAAKLQQTVRPTTTPAQRVSAQQLQMAAVNPVAAPTQIQRQHVSANRLKALTSTSGPRVSAVDLGQVGAVNVRAADIMAPSVVTGPRVVNAGAVVTDTAPQISAAFEEVGQVDFTGQASPGEYTEGPVNAVVIDTGVSDEFQGGTGGTGTAEGTVSCLQSAYSQRYLKVVEDRTKRRWTVPEDTLDKKVVLSFEIDASGTATRVEYDQSANAALGASAAAALRAASPFPPMTDNNRCLSELKLRATFDVPAVE